jgi:hypothetical protein
MRRGPANFGCRAPRAAPGALTRAPCSVRLRRVRCIFADVDGVASRRKLERDAERFWRGIVGVSRDDAIEIAERLKRAYPGLYARSVSGRSKLVAVGCDEPRLRPLRDLLVARAPRTLPFRLVPDNVGCRGKDAAGLVSALTRHDLTRGRWRMGFSRGHLLELTLLLTRSPRSEHDALLRDVELAVDELIGRERAEDWVGAVDVAGAPGGGLLKLAGAPASATIGFSELGAAVEQAVVALYAGLSPEPWHLSSAQSGWVMFEMEPDDPRGAAAQTDLLVATTAAPEMLKTFLEGAPFSSARFSRHSERFAYVKYRDTSSDSNQRLTHRTRLEDTVDRALRKQGLGAVVGNGIGVAHSYVNLALLDPPRAVPVLREAAVACALDQRSWLLFCDADWRDEWVGLLPGAPEPHG